MNPTLRKFVTREARAERRVLMVTGARLLDREDLRPVVQAFLREQLSRLGPADLYVSGGCPGSPDVWGHQIAYECGVTDHLMLLINGDWRHYNHGQVVYQGDWTSPAFGPGGPNRNAAMVAAMGLFEAHRATVLGLACQAAWAPQGGTGHTVELADQERVPMIRAVFRIKNGVAGYDLRSSESV